MGFIELPNVVISALVLVPLLLCLWVLIDVALTPETALAGVASKSKWIMAAIVGMLASWTWVFTGGLAAIYAIVIAARWFRSTKPKVLANL